MLLRHTLLVHHCNYGTVPFQSLTRSHTRIRSRSRTLEKPLLDNYTNVYVEGVGEGRPLHFGDLGGGGVGPSTPESTNGMYLVHLIND